MKKILVVDDQLEVRELVEATLNIGDYEIHKAGDGESALKMAAETHPDLIILDVMMPGSIDGYEVCRRLRANPETATSSIVMLTARGQEADRQKGKEVGADDYFAKPFSPLELLNKVEEMLGE
jgi:DNA-binding response OmpR family regulator